MFLGEIQNFFIPAGEANTVIPIKTLANTNDNVVNKGGVISFLKSGMYNIDASISVTGAEADNLTVTIFADDGARISVPATIPAPPDGATESTVNVSLVDAIKVILTRYRSLASIYIGVGSSAVTVDGYIRVEHVR